jgi:DNA invertase Pin-like site-specific DNA recombinase
MVRERTRVGLAAARDRGVKVGRPAKLNAHQQQEIIRSVRDGSKTAADAARLVGVHRSSITRLLARWQEM